MHELPGLVARAGADEDQAHVGSEQSRLDRRGREGGELHLARQSREVANEHNKRLVILGGCARDEVLEEDVR